jgi:Tfp pilus assembly protein PilN
MSSAPNQLSFLPDDYLELKAQRRTNAICAILFAAVVGVVGVTFQYTERSMVAVERDLADITRRYAEAARPIEQFRKMQEQQRKMETQAALSASLLEKVPRSYLLAEITNSLPPTVSLIDFSLEARVRSGAPAPGSYRTIFEQKKAEIEAAKFAAAGAGQPKAYDVFLKLTGVAENDVQVATFMNSLTRSKLLRDVNLVVSEEFQASAKDEKLRKFQVEMMLSPDAEIKATPQKLNNKVVEVDSK